MEKLVEATVEQWHENFLLVLLENQVLLATDEYRL